MEEKTYTAVEIYDVFEDVKERGIKAIPEGFDVNVRNKANGNTLLLEFIEDEDKVKALLEMGADPNIPDYLGIYPIFHAIIKGNKKVVGLLLDYGANINAQCYGGLSVLHQCMLKNNKELFFHLLYRGADINLVDDDGLKPYQYNEEKNEDIFFMFADEKKILEKIVCIETIQGEMYAQTKKRVFAILSEEVKFWLACVLFPKGFYIKPETNSQEVSVSGQVKNILEERIEKLESMVYTLARIHDYGGTKSKDFDWEKLNKGLKEMGIEIPKINFERYFGWNF